LILIQIDLSFQISRHWDWLYFLTLAMHLKLFYPCCLWEKI